MSTAGAGGDGSVVQREPRGWFHGYRWTRGDGSMGTDRAKGMVLWVQAKHGDLSLNFQHPLKT